MLIALSGLGGLLILFGGYLIVVEFRRFRRDRSPAPPLAPEDAARDRWTAMVTDLIVGLLLLSALITLQANATFGSASDLNGQAQKASARYQAANAEEQSLIEFGDRMTALLQQHTLAASQLSLHADQARAAGDTALANQLDAAARIESAQARVFHNGFLSYAPSAAGDVFTFDRDAALRLAEERNTDLRTLGPKHAQALESVAADDRAKAGKLLLAAAALIAGVFLWTITRLAWRQRRLATAIPALAAMVAGTVLLVVATLS
jgi:hypothetical protein